MTFLNPLVLIGLVAAGIPILIHLLQLKRLRKIDFSSVRFLKEIQHASAKRVKIRDFLLLILRSLAVASIVTAFARPALKGFSEGTAKSSAVIIVDNSPSTTARNELGEISSQIRNTAANIAASYHQGDDVGLIFTSDANGVAGGERSSTPRAAASQINSSAPSNISVTYSSAINAAVKRLSASNSINKEIFLVGDMQRSEFANPSAAPDAQAVRIFFLKTEASSNDNLSVRDSRLLNPVVEVSAPSSIEATVVNNDGADKSGVLVSLFLDGRKVSQSVVDLPSGGSRKVDLAFTVPTAGYHDGHVELEDNSIQSDNLSYFSFYAIRNLNVLIVGSDSTEGTDFISAAASAVIDTSTSVKITTLSPQQLVYTDVSRFDVVVVESYLPGSDFTSKLKNFVSSGGGAILFYPESAQLIPFSQLVSAMNVGSVAGRFSGTGGTFMSLDKIDAADDFFEGMFTTSQSADEIRSQLVTKLFDGARIEADPFSHVLMGTPAGPFLLGRNVGKGFAFVLASRADTLSSTLPLSPLFPVVMQRALFYSAAVSHYPLRALPGDNVSFLYTAGGLRKATLVSPTREKSDILPEYVGGAAKFNLSGLDRLGTYALTAGDTLSEISVNIDPRESDLAQASDKDIAAFAKTIGFEGKNIFVVAANKNSVQAIDRLRQGYDLSSFFAGAALLFLVLEIFVSRMKTF